MGCGRPACVKPAGRLCGAWSTSIRARHRSASAWNCLKKAGVAEHLRGLIKAYRIRRDAAIAALERYAPDEVYWTVPAGGYYIWVSLPDGVRSLDVLESCRSQGVTFMPGSVFDVDEMDDSHIRLNFVRPDAADIDTGIRIIGETIAQM